MLLIGLRDTTHYKRRMGQLPIGQLVQSGSCTGLTLMCQLGRTHTDQQCTQLAETLGTRYLLPAITQCTLQRISRLYTVYITHYTVNTTKYKIYNIPNKVHNTQYKRTVNGTEYKSHLTKYHWTVVSTQCTVHSTQYNRHNST